MNQRDLVIDKNTKISIGLLGVLMCIAGFVWNADAKAERALQGRKSILHRLYRLEKSNYRIEAHMGILPKEVIAVEEKEDEDHE